MSHPLDSFPLDWSDQLIRDVHRTLVGAVFIKKEIIADAQAAGLDAGEIEWDGNARLTWISVMNEAGRTGKMRDLLAIFRQRSPTFSELVDDWTSAEPATTTPQESSDIAGVSWDGFSDDSGTERQIVEGYETLLDIAFLEQGLRRAPSVCHLKVKIGNKRYVGTGFRIADNLILTNHHVVFQEVAGVETAASTIVAWFDYEADLDGTVKQAVKVECEVGTVIADAARDWAVVTAAESIPDRFPPLSISEPVVLGVDERVYIIQHPNGRPKMIGIHHNLVRSVNADVVQYWTDTEAGSSGSPVFDKDWNVVALHHRWISREANGDVEYRNQGQRIDRVLADMTAAGVEIDH